MIVVLKNELRALRERKEVTQAEVAKNINVSQQVYNRYEKGTREPDLATIKQLADYFGVSTEELLYGKLGASIQRLTLARKLIGISNLAHASGIPVELVELYALGHALPTAADERKLCETLQTTRDELYGKKDNIIAMPGAVPLDNPEVVRLRVVAKICAGNGGYVLEEDLGYEDILVHGKSKSAYNDTFCLKVSGDSMFPRIYPGDLVVIKPQRTADNGDMAAVIVDHETAILKRFYKTEKGIILKSDNAIYGETEYIGEEANRVYVVGKVIDMKAKRL